jgi:hypothetical protein
MRSADREHRALRLAHDLVSGGPEQRLADIEAVRAEHDEVAGPFGGDAQKLAMGLADRQRPLYGAIVLNAVGNEAMQVRGAGLCGGGDERAERSRLGVADGLTAAPVSPIDVGAIDE